MIIQCKHITSYKYENEVFLNPHVLYLLPQYRQYYQIQSYNIQINPVPTGRSQLVDLENNQYLQCWFSGLSDILEISVDLKVNTIPFNPLNFIYDLNFKKGPETFEYGNKHNHLLAAYLISAGGQDLRNFIVPIYKSSQDIVGFISTLNKSVYDNWEHEIRNEPGTHAPSFTYQYKKGSCRDLALMMIDMLRIAGIASRFVSGYAYSESLKEEHYLHAWVEIFIPGAGWIGIDPSLGLFTDHRYIPLASSYLYSNTSPVFGTFGGSSNSSLDAYVELTVV